MSDTDAENRLIVERLLGWTIWNSAGIEFVFGSTIQLSHYTFLTGDQMLLLLEAMAKRGLEFYLSHEARDVEWVFYVRKGEAWNAVSGDITAPAVVRAAALAVVLQK